MIITKIISTIFIGLLLSIGLWVACYIFRVKIYPRDSLQIRHHLFSLIIAIVTFILYCSFSSISATISGIEHTLNSVKEAIVEKSDIVDNIAAILSSDATQQTTINETYNSILLTLNTDGELNDYIEDMDFSKLDTKDIAIILNINDISVKDKSVQIIDKLFDSYIGEFTKTLKK